MVVYFTGTGNSRYCANMIAASLQDECIDAGSYIKNQIAAELITGKPWVFVAPTYAWQLPRIFVDFLRSGSFSGAEDAYFVMTCGGDIGNAGGYIEPLCRELGLRYRGVMPVVMPENYVAMFPVPDKQESAEIIARARPVVQNAVGYIRSGHDFPQLPVTLADKAKSGKINQMFYTKYVSAKKFYAKDTCISCGKCVESCVLRNIRPVNGKPVWGADCTHCMACICGCPVEAIEYGKKSQGKPRYQCPEYP